MSLELFEKVRSRQVRYVPRDGDVMALRAKVFPHTFHIKVIVEKIVSINPLLDGTSLVLLYVPDKKGRVLIHTSKSYICIAALYLGGLMPCEFEYIGSEPVFTWEREIDIGFARYDDAVEITEYERELYSQDCDVLEKSGELIAVPFYDTENCRMDHVPHYKLQDGSFATFSAILNKAEEWMRKNNILY